MKTVAIDVEYDYLRPFLATITDDQLQTTIYRLNVLSERKKLRELCENPSIRKVFHNAAGDIFQLKNIGIAVSQPYECTLILSNIVDENFAPKNLKKLAQVHLNEDTKEVNRLKSVIKKYRECANKEGKRFKWSDIPDEYIVPYAKRDPEYTIQLWYYWQKPLIEYKELYRFEKSLIPIIVEMVSRGMRIDRFRCKMISREYGRKLENLHKQMVEYVGRNFNPNSPKQVQEMIIKLVPNYEYSGIQIDNKTRLPKTDKDALLTLALKTDIPLFKWVSQYRFFAKHKSTYYDSLYEYYTSENSDIAHFLLYQTGAKSGRFSAELVQTFPKPEKSIVVGELHEVRKCVIPRRGKVFLCKDYEQQEMRLFIHYSNCERMIELINQKGGRGVDCYVETANILFGELFQREHLRKALRWVSKQNTLGAIYGIGQSKLIWQTTHLMMDRFDRRIIEELGVSNLWAYDVLEKFYELYPIREFMRQKTGELFRQGYVRLKFDSPLMKFVRDYRVPRDKAYKAVNIVIQGTAAYVMKCAMKRVSRRIKKEGWQDKVNLLMTVHDELIFEIDEDMDLNRVDKVLSEEMEDWVTFKVPITTSAKWSAKSWGDVVDLYSEEENV